MPNDAKLGLLAGVIGVIIVGAMSARQAPVDPVVPAPRADTAGARTNVPAETRLAGPETAPVARTVEPTSTPIIRKNREPDGTPAGRTPMDDIDQ